MLVDCPDRSALRASWPDCVAGNGFILTVQSNGNRSIIAEAFGPRDRALANAIIAKDIVFVERSDAQTYSVVVISLDVPPAAGM